ncbi:MAG: amino acid permease [Deltaproteobacteria bacterium]|nr:amino acid permease [Deltaproteobacteria bacterium]
MAKLFARKPVESFHAYLASKDHSLKRALGPLELTLLGIGAIIGTGIFVLTGVAAVDDAGPAVVLSFALAGLACGFAALCYSEFATMIPISGSAYSYGYATLGELVAWIIGWDLVLEYALASSAVASGWSGYAYGLLGDLGVALPHAISGQPDFANGVYFNVLAFLILLVVTALLVIGVRESARTNAIFVALKTAVVLLVIALGVGYVNPENWTPFLHPEKGLFGIVTGAATVFFAYIGFDAVTTAAEESRNPERDMKIGIIGSLAVCTLLYLIVSAILTGMVPVAEIDKAAPVASAFRSVGENFAASAISFGVIVGLPSVLIVMLLGQSRVFFAMSRDGLLPAFFSKIHPRFGTPYLSSLLVGAVVAPLAGLGTLETLAHLVSIGTLFAFVIVSAGVLVLRVTDPDRRRPFRCPAVWFVAPASIAICLYLMSALPWVTWERFLIWLGLGLAVYFAYGMRHSRVQKALASR